MKKQFLAALLLAALIGPVQAQVRKCTGPDGKVTYSDFVCASGASKEDRVKTNANTIDASGYRQEAQRNKAEQAADAAMQQRDAKSQVATLAVQNGASKCEFASFKNGDSKGQQLAIAAKQECLENLAAKASGQPTSLEAYNFWKDHHQMQSAKRSAARANSMNCMPNGFGGLRCN